MRSVVCVDVQRAQLIKEFRETLSASEHPERVDYGH